ncbi:RING-H2 finger protein ATL18 [Populus alba x Populus x berolinensis]|nr:RING-H2 finger protein ATL18 [Populus alba x Populus x berolinensis]
MATVIFYTCVLIPLRQIKQTLFSIILQEKDVCCSICLMELEKEDEASQLSRCMHVFHMDCIEKWIQRDHFTCPLCRTSIDH